MVENTEESKSAQEQVMLLHKISFGLKLKMEKVEGNGIEIAISSLSNLYFSLEK